jgi:hypothetical protein
MEYLFTFQGNTARILNVTNLLHDLRQNVLGAALIRRRIKKEGLV